MNQVQLEKTSTKHWLATHKILSLSLPDLASFGSWATCHRTLCFEQRSWSLKVPTSFNYSVWFFNWNISDKRNHCLIQCSTTLIRTQVGSYQWIWLGTFQERRLHQKTSTGHCHSNTASWTKAGEAGCCSARWSKQRSRIQDARLPKQKEGSAIQWRM